LAQILKEFATQEGSGTTKEREEKEIFQTLREPTSPFYNLRGIDGRNVRL